MAVILLVLFLALTPVLTFVATLIGGVVGFVLTLAFHGLGALVKSVYHRFKT